MRCHTILVCSLVIYELRGVPMWMQKSRIGRFSPDCLASRFPYHVYPYWRCFSSNDFHLLPPATHNEVISEFTSVSSPDHQYHRQSHANAVSDPLILSYDTIEVFYFLRPRSIYRCVSNIILLDCGFEIGTRLFHAQGLIIRRSDNLLDSVFNRWTNNRRLMDGRPADRPTQQKLIDTPTKKSCVY